ncbi:hypothetical protein GOB85_07055 [Acetobacter sp. LMG 1636]|uniref:Lipoprotein n=2 Tax=Acetobacter fallax TaxID=1737473 RepID=A0ABX0K982_9PROT|nr:hypothetical protein [Acetobacter fallax]NHO35881.1 hypothetical protein [Acetobacter fallax]
MPACVFLLSCRMSGQDPRAGDNIDVPSERPGRDFPEAAEAEQRRERNADYSDASAPKGGRGGYEPAPYAGTSLPKPGTSNVTPDTEVTYGRPAGTTNPKSGN